MSALGFSMHSKSCASGGNGSNFPSGNGSEEEKKSKKTALGEKNEALVDRRCKLAAAPAASVATYNVNGASHVHKLVSRLHSEKSRQPSKAAGRKRMQTWPQRRTDSCSNGDGTLEKRRTTNEIRNRGVVPAVFGENPPRRPIEAIFCFQTHHLLSR